MPADDGAVSSWLLLSAGAGALLVVLVLAYGAARWLAGRRASAPHSTSQAKAGVKQAPGRMPVSQASASSGHAALLTYAPCSSDGGQHLPARICQRGSESMQSDIPPACDQAQPILHSAVSTSAAGSSGSTPCSPSNKGASKAHPAVHSSSSSLTRRRPQQQQQQQQQQPSATAVTSTCSKSSSSLRAGSHCMRVRTPAHLVLGSPAKAPIKPSTPCSPAHLAQVTVLTSPPESDASTPDSSRSGGATGCGPDLFAHLRVCTGDEPGSSSSDAELPGAGAVPPAALGSPVGGLVDPTACLGLAMSAQQLPGAAGDLQHHCGPSSGHQHLLCDSRAGAVVGGGPAAACCAPPAQLMVRTRTSSNLVGHGLTSSLFPCPFESVDSSSEGGREAQAQPLQQAPVVPMSGGPWAGCHLPQQGCATGQLPHPAVAAHGVCGGTHPPLAAAPAPPAAHPTSFPGLGADTGAGALPGVAPVRPRSSKPRVSFAPLPPSKELWLQRLRQMPPDRKAKVLRRLQLVGRRVWCLWRQHSSQDQQQQGLDAQQQQQQQGGQRHGVKRERQQRAADGSSSEEGEEGLEVAASPCKRALSLAGAFAWHRPRADPYA